MTSGARAGFVRLAWVALVCNVVVILWGAFVRASGSGAGCGAHWPLCNGVVVPRAPRLETLIELSHRLSSGVALVVGLGLLVVAWRRLPAGHLARRAAGLAFVFLLAEAAIGAGLVLFRLVDDNESSARAISMAIHLSNTYLLLGALVVAIGAGSAGGAVALAEFRRRHDGRLDRLSLTLLAALILAGVTGAIAALGDTLYPSASLTEGLRQDVSRASAALLRLRAIHPFVAVAAGGWAWYVAVRCRERVKDRPVQRTARAVAALVALQIILGVINVALLAPIWMQLLHLLISNLLWLAAVAMASAVRWERFAAR